MLPSLSLLPIFLLTPLIFAEPEPHCSLSFGHPERAACLELVNQLSFSWPYIDPGGQPPNMERELMWFAADGTPRPTPAAANQDWAHIPKFAVYGGCVMALTPLTNGLWDTGYYRLFREPGLALISKCMSTNLPIGGMVKVGDREHLVLTLFAIESDVARNWVALFTAPMGTCADIDLGPHVDPKTQDCAMASARYSFYHMLRQTIAWESANVTPDVTGPHLLSCGDICFGSRNGGCRGPDNCKCIADAFQGPGSKRYQGRCKPGYYARSTNRDRELLSLDLDPIVNNTSSNYGILVEGSPPQLQLGTPVDRQHLEPDSTTMLGGVKASETVVPAACPCNCTYVSIACCIAEGGMVWEEGLHLGKLEPGSGKCCNRRTGELQDGDRGWGGTFCEARKSGDVGPTS